MEGPDDVLGVELGVAGEETAAGDDPVAESLQTVEDLPSGNAELDGSLLTALRRVAHFLRQQTDFMRMKALNSRPPV